MVDFIVFIAFMVCVSTRSLYFLPFPLHLLCSGSCCLFLHRLLKTKSYLLFVIFLASQETMTSVLPDTHRPYCTQRAEHFGNLARSMDRQSWQCLETVLGRPPVIWEYVEYKLRTVLARGNRIWQADHPFVYMALYGEPKS